MGYFIAKRGNSWKLFHRIGDKKARYVPKQSQEFLELGLKKEMPLDEAKEKLKPVQAARRLEWEREKEARAEARVKKTKLISGAWLPDVIVLEFEKGAAKLIKKRPYTWAEAKTIIATIETPPEEWSFWSESIYTKFKEKGRSPDYTRRVLKLINRYGHFYCLKRRLPFEPIKDLVAAREVRVEFKKKGKPKPTPPLTLEILTKLKGRIPEAWWNWYFCAFWLFLRSDEVDLGKVKLVPANHPKFDTVAEIYMPKVDKTKGVPLIFPEQKEAIKLLSQVEKPVTEKVPENVFVRSPRRGGSEHLKRLGFNQECRKAWLGHVDKSTLGQHYDDTRIPVYFDPSPGFLIKKVG